MSGTSLDGLDMAHVEFWQENKIWNYAINEAITLEYSQFWKEKLKTAQHLTGEELLKLDLEFGHFIGKTVNNFIQKIRRKVDLVASHGHTIFHNPAEGYTLQIGNGHAISSHLKCTVVNDFRSQDIVAGGQGAPLVPMGDQLLFSDFQGFLNIGGFANIYLPEFGAWDICAANLVLNSLSEKLGYTYDSEGSLSKSGKLIPDLYKKLESLDYYLINPPKSLGREWVESEIYPLFENINEPKNIMRTYVEHISSRIAFSFNTISGRVLITGGGAKNSFLIEQIQQKSNIYLHIPEENLINFKEALIFGFLGLLKKLHLPNIDGRLTGSGRMISAGTIYQPVI